MSDGIPWFVGPGFNMQDLIGETFYIQIPREQLMIEAEEIDGAYVITSLDAPTPS